MESAAPGTAAGAQAQAAHQFADRRLRCRGWLFSDCPRLELLFVNEEGAQARVGTRGSCCWTNFATCVVTTRNASHIDSSRQIFSTLPTVLG